MTAGKKIQFRQVGWNGVRLTVPVTWEAILGGYNHLIFEEEFSPLLEIRWHKAAKKNQSQSQSIFRRIKRTAATLHEKKLPSEWVFLKNEYDVTCYGKKDHSAFDTGICVCKQCRTLLLFQLSHKTKETSPLLVNCLQSLSCHCAPDEPIFWSLQDFQLKLPSNYFLIDSSFVPGLTRISFRCKHTTLHTCKLGPADARLTDQSLEEILKSLADIPDLPVQCSEDGDFCMGRRAPTISRQLGIRFKRKKPFILAQIRHDSANNRLLAVILESLRPIPLETGQSIYNNYEII